MNVPGMALHTFIQLILMTSAVMWNLQMNLGDQTSEVGDANFIVGI